MVGGRVSLVPGSDPYSSEGNRQRTTDAHGMVDFGVVKPGDWSLLIVQKADVGAHQWEAKEILYIMPGSKVAKSIVCPKSQTDYFPVQISVNWPSDLRDKNLAIAARIEHAGMTFSASLKWLFSEDEDILCGPKSSFARIADPYHFYLWRKGPPRIKSHIYVNIQTINSYKGRPVVELPEGEYHLIGLLVMRPASIPAEPHKGEQFELITHTELNLQLRTEHSCAHGL